jgi:hypothetical protein
MAVVRRALIGTIVAIFGVAVALGVVYPAGAKPAKGHPAQCASKTAKAKVKRGDRRAKCKKAKKKAEKTQRGRSEGAKTVGPTTGTTGAPAGTSTTGTGATGPAGGTTTGMGVAPTPTIRPPESSERPTKTPQPPPPLIAAGASVVSVYATATYPDTISLSRTITERVPFLQLVEVVESATQKICPHTPCTYAPR